MDGSNQQENSSRNSRPPTAYLVNFTYRARRDLAKVFSQIEAETSDAALLWFRGLKEAILSLENHPYRCPVTAEDEKLRHLLYGNKPHVYRVIFKVLEKQKRVNILQVRHGARRGFGPGEVE